LFSGKFAASKKNEIRETMLYICALRRISVLFAFALASLLAFAAAAQAPVTESDLRRARDLIRDGKPQAALELLEPLRAQGVASAELHYFLGLAKLDSGDADGAIVELKASLRINPALAQARAELGRAYLYTGNYLAAHSAFDQVRRANPPADVLASIERFVEGVHGEVNAGRKRFRGSVTVGMGHDSNVNSATSAQQVTLPILGGIVATLSPSGRAQSDSFNMLGAEVSGFVPLTAATELHASGGVQAKLNRTIDTFDYFTGNALAGLRHTFGQNQVAASFALDTIRLDNTRVRDSNGVNLEWRRIVHPLAEISAFGQFSQLDYPRDPFRDARREVYGFAVNPVAFGKRLFNLPPVASVYAGTERPTGTGVEHLGHRLSGARTAIFWQINSRLSLFGAASYERREYGAPDPLFAVARIDKQTDLSAGLLYSLNKDWTLTPVISYTDNRSNTDVFRYERTAVTLGARYGF
jgi:hypothetical protein